MSSALRDAIRSTVFSAKPKSKLVPVGDQMVEVRQALVGQMIDSMGTDDPRKRMARTIIDSCFVPNTDEKVFEEADFDMLMSLPAGGLYSELMTAISDLIEVKKVEAEAKKP